MTDKGALGQGFLQVLLFSLISIIRPKLHTQFHLHGTLTIKTKGQSLGTSKMRSSLRNRKAFIRSDFHFLCVCLQTVGTAPWSVSTGHKSCTYTEQHRHTQKNITLHPCCNVRGSRTHNTNIRETDDYHGANIQFPFVQLTVNIIPTKCTYN
jgi:hypothetical protein